MMRASQRGLSTMFAVSTLLLVTILLGAVWLSTGLVAKDRFPIHWIEVQGQFSHVSAEHVRRSVLPYAEQGFFAADLGAVKSAVEKLPWVAGVSVSRQWPDTLAINVREHDVMANWAAGGLINRDGGLFEIPAGYEVSQLPLLAGPEGARAEVVEMFHRANELLRGSTLDVSELRLSERGAWQVQTQDGMQLALGAVEPLERLRSFSDVYTVLLQQRERPVVAVDMRYPNGMAVRWAEAEPVAMNDRKQRTEQP